MGVFCEIGVIQPPNNTFSPGSVVRGTIRYAFDEDTTVKRLSASLVGGCYLDVLESRGSGENETRNHDVRKEKYVDIESIMWDGAKLCPIGCYETRFKFTLPESIPSSLNYYKNDLTYTIKCYITYKVKICFKFESLFKLNKTFESEIKVVSPITPRLKMEPRYIHERKTLFKLFGGSENTIYFKGCIQNSVIEPGGKIELTYELQNNSNKTVNAISTKLIEVYTFNIRKTANLKMNEKVNGTIKTSSIKSEETLAVHEKIEVPLEIGSLDHSKLVSREYVVVIKVELPMPHTDMVLEVPVQIGNTTIKRFYTEIPNEPPPSYWEAMNECEAKYK